MTPTRLRSRRLLVVAPAVTGVGVALLMVVLSWGVDTDGAAPGFVVRDLVPHVALAVVVLEVSRHAPSAWPALAVGVALHTAVTVLAVGSLLLGESSTGALIFLFLPAYLLVVVVLTAAAAGVTHAVRARNR